VSYVESRELSGTQADFPSSSVAGHEPSKLKVALSATQQSATPCDDKG
jgi:hypothetical protein